MTEEINNYTLTSRVKKRTFEIIGIAKRGDKASKIFDICLIALIFLNMFSLVIDTYDINESFKRGLEIFELVSMVLFTIEYILRIWTSDLLYSNKTKVTSRLRYIFSLEGIIDLLSIMPGFLPRIFPKGMVIARSFKTLRALKLFKIKSSFNALDIVKTVLKNKFYELLSTFYIIFILIITSSVLMYHVENELQPDVFKNAFSGFWWTVQSITTVGYGDIAPISGLGQLLAILITLLGVTLLALPTAILTEGFIEESQKRRDSKDKKDFCPFCGKSLK